MLTFFFIALALLLLGLLLRSALRGGDNEKIAFVVNIMILWALAAVTFGYPGILIPAMLLLPVVFVILFLLTTGNTVPVAVGASEGEGKGADAP